MLAVLEDARGVAGGSASGAGLGISTPGAIESKAQQSYNGLKLAVNAVLPVIRVFRRRGFSELDGGSLDGERQLVLRQVTTESAPTPSHEKCYVITESIATAKLMSPQPSIQEAFRARAAISAQYPLRTPSTTAKSEKYTRQTLHSLRCCTISATCVSSETTRDDCDTDQARRNKRHLQSRA